MLTPIAITVVDWPSYLLKAKQALGFSVSDAIDSHRLKQELSSFFVSLMEWDREKVDPARAIREAGSLLRHGSVTFMCILPVTVLFSFQQEVDLAINSVEIRLGHQLAIISGNLQQWCISIINCSSDRVSSEIRQIANVIMAYFEANGLGGIWSGYVKTSMNDQTMQLRLK